MKEAEALEWERQVAVEQLEAHFQRLLDRVNEHLSEFKGTSLAVAEFGVELKMRRRDFGELANFVVEDIKVAGQIHGDLKEKVLHVEQQVMSLEEWSNDITTNLNDVQARVDNWNSGRGEGEGRARSEPVRFNRQARAGYKYWPPLGCGVPVNLQHMFPQSLVLLSVHHLHGGHSSCIQIVVRTVHTVQQTVGFHRYSFWMVVDAPVVVQRQVPWLVAQ